MLGRNLQFGRRVCDGDITAIRGTRQSNVKSQQEAETETYNWSSGKRPEEEEERYGLARALDEES